MLYVCWGCRGVFESPTFVKGPPGTVLSVGRLEIVCRICGAVTGVKPGVYGDAARIVVGLSPEQVDDIRRTLGHLSAQANQLVDAMTVEAAVAEVEKAVATAAPELVHPLRQIATNLGADLKTPEGLNRWIMALLAILTIYATSSSLSEDDVKRIVEDQIRLHSIPVETSKE